MLPLMWEFSLPYPWLLFFFHPENDLWVGNVIPCEWERILNLDVVLGFRGHLMKLCIGSSEKSTSFTKNKVIFKEAQKKWTILDKPITYYRCPTAFHKKDGNSPQWFSSKIPRTGVLTHREEVPIDLQHHVLVQASLGRVQMLPLLPAEAYGHILKWHWSL